MVESHSSKPPDPSPVSPELALVDPELAAWARTRLADPAHAHEALAFRRLTAVSSNERLVVAETDERSEERGFTVLVGVAAVLVVTLLLADVRVEVGKNGASAEAPRVTTRSGLDEVTQTSSRPGPATPRSASSGIPPPAKQSRPSAEPRQLAWAPVPDAEAYHVELYRDNTRIFAAETQRAVVTVPVRWTLNGKARTLAPGELRWYVWPLVDGRRSTTAIVQATLTIPRS